MDDDYQLELYTIKKYGIPSCGALVIINPLGQKFTYQYHTDHSYYSVTKMFFAVVIGTFGFCFLVNSLIPLSIISGVLVSIIGGLCGLDVGIRSTAKFVRKPFQDGQTPVLQGRIPCPQNTIAQVRNVIHRTNYYSLLLSNCIQTSKKTFITSKQLISQESASTIAL